MRTTLNENGLRRIIRVYGVERPVEVLLRPEGISFRIAGRGGKSVSAPWPSVVKACSTPPEAKCYDAGDPLGLLVREAQKKTQRDVKRAAKESDGNPSHGEV